MQWNSANCFQQSSFFRIFQKIHEVDNSRYQRVDSFFWWQGFKVIKPLGLLNLPVSVRGLSCDSVATFSKLDNMNKLSNRLFLNIAGIFVGTLATFQTVSCVVEPTDHMHHVVARVAGQEAPSSDVSLFDFTTPGADVGGWIESSDTVRVPGKSKALMVLQKARLFQRAVFFALLNPQPNGAGFAGIRHPTDFDLSQFSKINIKMRGQGQHKNFKITLKHHGEIGDSSVSYEQFFEAPTGEELQVLSLPLIQFEPYWRGMRQNDSQPLDTASITSMGIQFYGGVYEEGKQSGPATLEIDWIKASNWVQYILCSGCFGGFHMFKKGFFD